MEADTVGQRIQRVREQRKLSRQQLADMAGVGVNAIHGVETGRRYGKRLTLETGIRLAKALGVTLDYLAGAYEGQEEAQ
jgi:transcriptional regulator with XRE-family HTH domain